MDPRWKLAAVVAAVVATAAVRSETAALVACGASLLLVALTRTPWTWYWPQLRNALVFVVLFAAALPFLLGGPAWRLGPIWVSVEGLRVAVVVCAKAASVLSFVLVLRATSRDEDLLRAASALRVPGLLVQLASLTHRYLIVSADELARLRVAVRVRGFRTAATLHGYRTIGQVAGTLLLRGHERAERVHHAMRCRGFEGRFRSIHDFSTRWFDVAACGLIVAASVALLFLDRVAA
jgi:cobalt/nickel transport system permease protein